METSYGKAGPTTCLKRTPHVIEILFAAMFAGDPLFEFQGNAPGERFGYAVASGADLNQDGTPDLLIAAPGVKEDMTGAGGTLGKVRAVSGSDGALIYEFTGNDPGAEFGFAVEFIGDLDNDGFVDFAIGEPLDDDGQKVDSGAIHVRGGVNGLLKYILFGSAAGDRMGTSIQGLDDATGNSFGDFLAGSPGSDAGGVDSGKATLFFGFTGFALGELTAPNTPGLLAGTALGRTPPLPGASNLVDGVVGAPGGDRVFVFRVTAQNITLTSTINAPSSGVGFGSSVVASFDFDLDGQDDDIAIGSPDEDVNGVDRGTVRVYERGNPLPAAIGVIPGLNAGDQFGTTLDVVPSFNGAGHDGLLTGGPGGGVATLHGPNGNLVQVFGGAPGFGRGVSPAGDITGDGLTDVILGSPNAVNSGGVASGLAVVSHPTNAASGDVTLVGPGCPPAVPPTLDLLGCTRPTETVYVKIAGGPAGGTAVVLLGYANGATPLFPGCVLSLANFDPSTLALPLDGAGRALTPVALPQFMPVPSALLQAPILHPNGVDVTVTEALQVLFQ